MVGRKRRHQWKCLVIAEMGNTGGVDSGEKVSLTIHSRTIKLQGAHF